MLVICLLLNLFYFKVSAQAITTPKIISPLTTSINRETICNNIVTLRGNKPNYAKGENGYWENISPGLVNFLLAETNDSVVIELLENGKYTFLWHITDSLGADQNPALVYLNNLSPSEADITTTGPIETCLDNQKLDAKAPVIGTGKWIANNDSVVFVDSSKPNTTATKLPKGESKIYWVVSSIGCDPRKDSIIIGNISTTKPFAGISRTVCTDTVHLKANPIDINEFGIWSYSSSPTNPTIQISSPGNTETIAKNLLEGSTTFTWTVSNDDECRSSGSVTIKYQKQNTAVIITKDSTITCEDKITLNATPVSGTGGTWSFINGPAIPNSTSPTVNVTGLPYGVSKFAWTVINPNCQNSSVTVTILNQSVTTPNIVKDSCFIYNNQKDIDLRLKNPLQPNETGVWSSINHVGSTNLVNPAGNNAKFTPNTAGFFKFKFVVSGNGNNCRKVDSTRYTFLTKAALPQSSRCLYVDKTTLAASGTVEPLPANRPVLSEGEKGQWELEYSSPPVTNPKWDGSSPDGKLVFTDLQPGVYKFKYSITNTNCPTCSCANSASITISVLTNASILTSGVQKCTNDSIIALKANKLLPGGKGKWILNNGSNQNAFLPRSDVDSAIAQLPRGKNIIYWQVTDTSSKCISKDSVIISRLTKANAGPDVCFASTDQTFTTQVGSIKGNLPNSTLGEVGVWLKSKDPNSNDPFNYPNTDSQNNDPIQIRINNSGPDNYILRYAIYTSDCGSLWDTVNVTFTSKSQTFEDLYYVLPLNQSISVTGKSVRNTSLGVTDTASWTSPRNEKTPGSILTIPTSIKAGLHLYTYEIKNKKRPECTFPETAKIRIITSPKITGPNCIVSTESFRVQATDTVTGEKPLWISKNPKVVISDAIGESSKQVSVTGPVRAYIYRTISVDGKVRATDSLSITKLTSPIIQLENTCSKGPTYFINQKDTIQPYESAQWLKSGLSAAAAKFQNGKKLKDTILNFLPGQINLKLIIKGNACADTSSTSVALVAISKPNIGTDQCTTSSTIPLNILPNTIELYTWKKTGNNAILSKAYNPNLPLIPLENYFELTIRSKLDSVKCFASDTVKITRITKAIIDIDDVCIKGADTIRLTGNPVIGAETGKWYKGDTSLSVLSNPVITYRSLKQGNNPFKYKISYNGCSDSSSFKAIKVDKAKIETLLSCLKIPATNLLNQDVKVNNGKPNPQLSYKWLLTSQFKDTMSTKDSIAYSFKFRESGIRNYKWVIASILDPGCFTQDSVSFIIIPKAYAGNDTCISSYGNQAKIFLKGSAVNSSKGETGKWTSSVEASFHSASNPQDSATFESNGRIKFEWAVSNNGCTDSDSLIATHISKPQILDSNNCYYFNQNKNYTLNIRKLNKNSEVGTWVPSSVFFTSDSTVSVKLDQGLNVFKWRVSAKDNPSCFDTVSVKYATFAPSGFNKPVETLYTCTKDTLLKINQFAQDNVVWTLNSGSKISNLIPNPSQNDLILPALSNDTLYSLYRSVNNKSWPKCVLVDTVRILNRQLEPVTIFPSSVQTCEVGYIINVPRPKSDLKSANGELLKVSFPDANIGKVIPEPDSNLINYIFKVSNLNSEGDFIFKWRVFNDYCPERTSNFTITKKLGLPRKPIQINLCNNETYNFNNANFDLIVNPDYVAWTKGNDTISKANSKDLTYKIGLGDILINYTAYKNGCSGGADFYITNSERFVLDSTKDGTTRNRFYNLCEKDSLIVLNTHLFQSTNNDLKLNFSYSKTFRDSLTSNRKTTLYKYNDYTLTLLKGLKNNFTTQQKIYILAQNGACSVQVDSITITNSKKPIDVEAGDDETLCSSSIRLRGITKGYSGKWSSLTSSQSIITYNPPTDTIAKAARGSNSYLWTVQNGACIVYDTVNYFIGDTLPPANIANDDKFLTICDSSAFHLKAIPIAGKAVWLFRQDTLPTGNQNVFNYPFVIDNRFIDKSKVSFVKADFVWKVYNDYCFNTDTMHVTYYQAPTKAIAGENQSIVKDNTTLAANTPQFGTGKWSVLKGLSEIDDLANSRANIKQLSPGENVLTWTITNGPCPASTDHVTITYSDFDIPSGFSPNGDGKNDFFEIKGLENYPDTELKVFNRWGILVFNSKDYKNDWNADGLSDDTYFYELVVSGSKDKHGYILVKRK